MHDKVKNLIRSHEKSKDWKDIAYYLCGNDPELYDNELTKDLKEKHGIIINTEDGYGGEGCGDEYWGVFSIEWDGKKEYIRLSGWYASYSGGEIDPWDWTEVKRVPVQTYEWRSV